MSVQINATPTVMAIEYDEPMVDSFDNTTDNTDPITGSEDELGSISSEESGGLGNDSDHRVRAKSIQEIWEDEVIWDSLQTLPGAYELFDLIHAENIKLLMKHPRALDTGIMLAAWIGNEKVTKALLEEKANPNTEDNHGRTPLHLAACTGSEHCIKVLLNHGAFIEKWDSLHKATPLHCAASRGHLSCIKLLIKHGADVNASNGSKSALHYAVQCNAVECVRELLNAGAIPNTTKIFSETPLHIASALGSVEIIKLLLSHKAEVRVQCGEDKTTALHLAAEDGNAECARLLLDGGAKLSAVNKRQQTPLHFAALSQSSETLELLLARGANPKAKDIDGRTPLHGAIVKVSRSCECVRLLIKHGADVNAPDAFGYTPLHLAALNEFSQCVLLLLSHGGDVTARTNGGVSVLTFITRRTPDVIPKIVEKFNSSIRVNDHEIGDVDCELKLDFRVLVPSTCKGETELFLNFIEVGHRGLLKHPLCETFLFLKWRRIRKYFFVSLFYHFLFAALFTIYTIGVFLRNCPSMHRSGKPAPINCSVALHITIVGYVLIILNTMLLVKELFQIAHSWRIYIKEWENWLQWMIIISVFCCVVVNNKNIQVNLYAWHHHTAAIGIFFTWLELMMIVGRFPIFGLYVQMFTTVALNFAKFLMAYLCLLIAFALSFSVLLPNYPSFQNIFKSKLKIVMMMIGELEFEDIFYGDHEVEYSITTHIMFLAFVILVTIILMNLMVGLAVNDIQGLQQSAGLDRLVRQAELVAHLESILFSKLLNWVPRDIMVFFHKHALLLKSQYHWALYIKPNDPRETRIPKDLIKNIYELVAERKPLKKRRSEKFQYRYSGGGKNGSPPLSRMNSKNSDGSLDGGLDSAFRMRLSSLNRGVKNREYNDILMK